MILAKYTNNTFVLKEQDKQIDLKCLNLLINNFLKNRNELDEDASVVRAIRYSNYIVICCYASLVEDTLLNLLLIFLDEYNIEPIFGDLNEEDLKIIQPILPVISLRKGDQHGGITNDTSSIDPHVKSLSDVLNTYSGITTFSSCDGHMTNANESNFYVLFTAETMQDLSELTKNLWSSLEKVIAKYPDKVFVNLLFDYGSWSSIDSAYFEIRVPYNNDYQNIVFEAMAYLAELLRKD